MRNGQMSLLATNTERDYETLGKSKINCAMP